MSRRFSLVVIAFLVIGVEAVGRPPDPVAGARALLRQKKYDEAIKSLEAYLAGNRFDGPAWSSYGVALHMAKRFDRSIEASKKAIELGFNAANETYNIACAYAVMGKTDEAIAWIGKSLDAGFTEQETLETDDEIDRLRGDPRFIRLTGLKPPAGLAAEQQWAWDLDFLARRMEQMHWNLYAKISKEKFLGEIERLKTDAPHLSPARVRVRLSAILAMVGDGHTTLAAFAEGEKTIARIPLHLEIFKDGLFIIGAPEKLHQLVGAEVRKIGSLDTETALQRLRAFCSVDNEMTYLLRLPEKATSPAALQEIGAAADEHVNYTLRFPDGSTRTLSLLPEPVTRAGLGQHARFRPNYVYANRTCPAPAPLYQHELDKPLSLESLDNNKAIYFGFHEVAENPGESFAAFVERLVKLIAEKHAEFLIIDMRLNTGGNTGLILPLLHALIRDDRVNRPGHLFVIIGRHTFSAAQNTVNLLEMHTNATFVGEPTGSRPNFVGESTYIILPYSKLRVYCSSRYWQHVVSTDHRTWVQPQIAAELSFRDSAENRDPCMDAILNRIRTQK